MGPNDITAIMCIGLNYKHHAEELKIQLPKYPVLFMKNKNSVQNPMEPIRIPSGVKNVDFEAELAIVMGKTCKNVARKDALNYVLGYTCANDVTSRAWQYAVSQWCYAKSFDTFCPLGPALVSQELIQDPNQLKIHSKLNGVKMQDSNTDNMIFDVPSLIEFMSRGTTLSAGTVILTGSPAGVGYGRNPPVLLKKGDMVEIEIEKIGRLMNSVDE